jgi:D-glycero-beta-D-manno-heptose 1-phosphate adenylyltransferase
VLKPQQILTSKMLNKILSKIGTISQTIEKVKTWKTEGEIIVFTNGCFDLLHRGHVTYLAKAKETGTKLILGLNSDASVKRLGKGEARPINSEDSRALVIASLECIDAVVVFDEDTPLEIIKNLQPSIVVKGGDYDPEESDKSSIKYFVGAKETRDRGGKAIIISLVDGFSTTSIIEKLKK